MIQLKSISREGIPLALQKAERYRLLNEPDLAESICKDILAIDPDNQQAVVTLLLSITDQFGEYASTNLHKARELLQLIDNEYDRHYYSGIICEREGLANLKQGRPASYGAVYEWLTEAMGFFEQAEEIRPAGNDDSILRWNTCARLIMQYQLKPAYEQYGELPLE
ncbi:hypothetical protein [Puia dinghuensis]|uniref:Tetratricopeptide repeat protein n=1 Tax=Puia dinghuensis TaxID=1792502 RepID=A0A8J2XVR9_9BACT|nr:hypothetical protein [Puia dinghuensis]GGB18252.1 hypothetical protein GCM10011511_47610 [Puia dinghuensis]